MTTGTDRREITRLSPTRAERILEIPTFLLVSLDLQVVLD
jgi:hypothetical protein